MAVQHDERSTPEAILLWFLQVLGAVTAILFGVFGALSWQVANEANDLSTAALDLSREAKSQSDSANLVALLALCDQISAAAAAESSISAMVSSIFGSIPTATSTSVTSSSTASSSGSTSASSTSPSGDTPTPTDASSGTSPVESSSGAAGSSPLALGLGLGLVSIVVFISALTLWAAFKKRKSK